MINVILKICNIDYSEFLRGFDDEKNKIEAMKSKLEKLFRKISKVTGNNVDFNRDNCQLRQFDIPERMDFTGTINFYSKHVIMIT